MIERRGIKEKKQVLTNLIFLAFLPILVLMSGCASSPYNNLNILAQYRVSSLPSEERINMTAGLNGLVDNRPLKEKDNLPPHSKLKQPVSDIVTSILLKDFKKTRLFKEIHYPVQPTDDIVINGSINRLFFENGMTSWGKFYYKDFQIAALLPIFWLPHIFGVPSSREHSEIDISLEVKDSKTGVIIASFNASSKEDREIRIPYGPATGISAAVAFSNVANKLKEGLIEKINHYYNIN